MTTAERIKSICPVGHDTCDGCVLQGMGCSYYDLVQVVIEHDKQDGAK